MKKISVIVLAATAVLVAGCNKDTAKAEVKEPKKIETLEQKVSYMLGYNMARQAGAVDFKIDPELMAMAVSEVNEGKDQRFTEDEMRATMQAFQTQQQAQRQEKITAMSEQNLQAGKDFLAENAKKDGIVATESGLQYKVVRKGDGPVPTADDMVLAHYSGKTMDGKEFDSSYKRGEPAKFPVGSLIPGWVEALQLMPKGSKWELYIPGDLAYGPGGKMNRQTGEFDIEPNSLLIFELELLDINPSDEAEQAEGAEAAAEAK